MSNPYNIKYSSMDQLLMTISSKTDGWYTQLGAWKTSYTALIDMDSFTGQSATAAKSYLSEVHEFLLQSIYVAISRFQSDYLLYKDQYYNIESNIYATMSSETIKAIGTRITNEITYLNNIAGDIDGSLNSVADIFWRGTPSKATLEGQLSSEKNALATLNTNIENYENSKYRVANGELRDLLESLKQTIIMYRNSSNSVLSYNSGDISNQTQVLDLYKKVQSSSEYIKKNKEEIELASVHQQEVFAQMQEDYEKACKAREDEGRVKIITGVAAAIIGGVAIVCTAGAATPIVVTAAVAGGSSMAYGASNVIEGGQDVYYGAKGDLNSAAFNPIRDTVFMGNQGAYDLWGNLNMTVAGLCVPVSQSINGVAGASNVVLARTAATTIGKEIGKGIAVGAVSDYGTKIAAKEFNLNETEKTLINLGLNIGLQKGADKLDTKITGEAPFASGMSYEDAKSYNNYWSKVEAGNSTGHPGLTDADLSAWNFADSKVNEHIAINKVDSSEVVKLRAEEAGGVKGGSKTVKNIIDDVENGKISLTNNMQKGNYGEMKMDQYYESQGYERISTDKVTDLNAPTHQGIDGVYYNPDGHPPYIIAEAKYGSSKLSTLADGTPQMSDGWITGGNKVSRLEQSVGIDAADDILIEGYDRILTHINTNGSISTYSIDSYGNIIK